MANPRLFLLTPALSAADIDAFAPRFAETLAAGDVASVLVRLAPGADPKRIVSALFDLAAARDAALLVEDDARLAVRLGVDGVHVALSEAADAVASFKGQRIVGAGGLKLRDDAMAAGEAGVDYVMFGEPGAAMAPEALIERVDWWAEIFETPCVAYAQTAEQVGPLAAAGADFVALGEGAWSAEAVKAAMRDLGVRA